MAKLHKRSKNSSMRSRPVADKRAFSEQDMDDDIDTFHKERDFITLDRNEDMGDDSDEDIEQPVFDFKKDDDDADVSEEEDDDVDDSDEDDSDVDYDKTRPDSFAAKVSRQEKFLRQKIGGVEDERQPDSEEEEDEDNDAMWWGRKKGMYHGADVVDIEARSSDEENLKEEEAAAIRMQKERALSLSVKDFGLKDTDEDDSGSDGGDKTMQCLFGVSKRAKGSHADKMEEENMFASYEQIQKDFSAFTTEEKMNAVNSVAPELVKLIPELNDSLTQLQCEVNPLICQLKRVKDIPEELHNYLEMKQSLLLIYCQAISFYLLLKAEGHPVCDHPVIERLTKLKDMLVEMNALDDGLHVQIDDFVSKEMGEVMVTKNPKENNLQDLGMDISDQVVVVSSNLTAAEASELSDLAKNLSSELCAKKNIKSGCQNNDTGVQSMEMLKVRGRLEEKLKKKGLLVPAAPKDKKTGTNTSFLTNRQLQTITDFDDEVINDGARKGTSNNFHLSHLNRLSESVTAKTKVVSGDDDLPPRDELGERRRKHELRVLAKAGVLANDTADSGEEFAKANRAANDSNNIHDQSEESEDEFYREAKNIKAEKVLAKTELYSRPSAVAQPLPEDVDGKRHITYQMEKNKGLTRARKKLTKIPRKKYKLKHQKAVVRRKGQVREIRKPSGPYGGEVSGINPHVSRSVRFKN